MTTKTTSDILTLDVFTEDDANVLHDLGVFLRKLQIIRPVTYTCFEEFRPQDYPDYDDYDYEWMDYPDEDENKKADDMTPYDDEEYLYDAQEDLSKDRK